jgi:4-carboxymuconolactone decarboxylase
MTLRRHSNGFPPLIAAERPHTAACGGGRARSMFPQRQVSEAAMTHFPIVRNEELNQDQQALWDKLTLGPRGFYTGGPEATRLPDLYNAWLQFPAFGQAMLRLGDELRAHSDLPGKLRELVVLTTSAHLGARVEYEFHIPFALNEGLSEAVVVAIGDVSEPTFSDEAERTIYDANIQLLRTATITERTREEVVKFLGYRGLMQLIAAVTLYVATAYTTNVARVKLAGDFAADPEKLKDFFAGRPIGDGRS